MCQPYFGNEDYKLRILLRRSNSKNHYPKFRDKLLQAFPFVELAIIPKESSKIAFTKYEITNKLNDGTPVTDTDDFPDSTPAPASTPILFSNGGAEATDLSSLPELNS